MLFLGVKTHISMGLQRIVHENTLKVTILSVPAKPNQHKKKNQSMQSQPCDHHSHRIEQAPISSSMAVVTD